MYDQPLATVIKDAILQPLDDGTRQSAIARRLHQAIMLGLFEDGGQLPSETDLAAQLSVSTVTLRSALAELRSMGLVETRRGRGGGNFIKMPEGNHVIPVATLLEQYSVDDLRDLRDHAGVVCGGIAMLAAKRVRGSSFDRMKTSAGAVSKASSAIERAHVDLWFHMEIAAATRSPRLAKAELEIQTTLASLVWLFGVDSLSSEQASSQHLAIVDAMARGDGVAAQNLSEAHVHHAINPIIEFRMKVGNVS